MAQTTLNIRNIDADAVDRIKARAGARGITVGQYVERLVQLNDYMLTHGDSSRNTHLAALRAVGLEPVTV